MTYHPKDLIVPLPRIPMRPAKMIKLGDEFLKNVSKDELRLMQGREKDYKVKAMLQAAIHRRKECF